MLLVAPEVPDKPSRKPLLQGYGCHLRGGTLSCEVLFVADDIPAQELVAELRVRRQPPRVIHLDWTPLPPGLHGRVVIDIREEK